MIPSWLTQTTACWSLTCALSTEVNQSKIIDNEDDIISKRRRKSFGIGKVLSTLTRSTTTSFSSWTDSLIFNSHRSNEEFPIMVFRKSNNGINVHQGKKTKQMKSATVSRHQDGSSKEKNEMIYPVSPYDELPTIRDLFEQLSPQTRPNSQNQEQELRQEQQDVTRRHQQERQQVIRNKNDRPTGHQPRDRPPANTITEESKFWTLSRDAHEVPVMIEMPSSPVFSEDSELSLDENLWQDNDDDECDQRSLTPHPSYEDELHWQPSTITATEFHHLYHASVKAEQELIWPSDEDNNNNNSTQKKMITKKNRRMSTKVTRRDARVRLV
ncbi:MAG: hypothetical protein ACI8RD_004487 [Bacillariaceae sp.]|jgi:hypothetical protein